MYNVITVSPVKERIFFVNDDYSSTSRETVFITSGSLACLNAKAFKSLDERLSRVLLNSITPLRAVAGRAACAPGDNSFFF
jgi:hypothetical protein